MDDSKAWQKKFFRDISFRYGLPQWFNGKEIACNARATGDVCSTPGQEDSLEEALETWSRILAWRIPWTKELGRLQCIRLQKARHD